MSEPKDLEFELTDIDKDQLPKYTYSQKHNAQRVIMVGGENIQIEAKFPENFNMEPKIIHVEKPVIVKEIELREVEKPVIIEREKISFVDRPVIVKEIEVREIVKEVPVYLERIVEVEKPVIIEKEKFIEFPKWLKLVFILQSIAMFGIFVLKLIK